MKFVKTTLILMVLLACNQVLSAAILPAERQALIDFYNSTNGDSWTNKTGWKTAPLDTDGFAMPGTENAWYGVTTDPGNTTVLKLSPFGNNLVGTLPSSLGNLSNLQQLSLSFNQIQGTIPTELGNLSNLIYFDLDHNQLTGSIPSSLGNLSNLTSFRLHSNTLTGSIPSSLGNLSNLTELILNVNQLTGSIPSSLGNLINLKILRFNLNQLSGSIPSELGNLINLEELYLSSNKVTGTIPTSLSNLTLLGSTRTGIGWNALHTSDAALITFLNSKDSVWAATQTIAPANVAAATLNSTTVNLTWDAIPYTGGSGGGGYRISVGTASGGPYTFFQQTADKSVTSMPVTGLIPGTPYYFVISTRTYAHPDNANVVDSDNSAEISAITLPVHTVTFVEGAGGTISGAKVQVVDYGAGCSAVEAVPSTGYHFVNWSGGYTGTTNPLTVTNVTDHMTITANFAVNQYPVSGTVLAGGSPLAGVVMSGLTGNPTTNASGIYSGTVDYGWSGTVTPTLVGYTFSPANRVYSSVIAGQTAQDYTATLNTYTISGTVTDGANPISGVTITFSHNGHTETTAADGAYSNVVNYGATTTLTPTKTGYASWTPASITLTNVTATQIGRNFTASLLTYGVSGTVLAGGSPLAGVVMSGLTGSPTTNASGIYSGTVDYGWSGTVTPTLAGFSFNPANRAYSGVIANQTAQDYTATLNTYIISGTVLAGGSPLAGVVMSGLTGNPTTNASGIYSGTVDYGWTGTVTPTLAGYTFTPTARPYTSISTNQTGQDYAASLIPAVITVSSPNGGEGWIVRSTHNIAWTTTGTAANVRIEYSTNNGTNWTTIIASTANTNSYSWTLPLVASPSCLVRVSEAETGTPSDVSNAVFAITAGVPTIGLSKTSFIFGSERYGAPTPAETVILTSGGTGILNWTATPSVDWISVLPGSGTGSGVLTIRISRTDMSPGYYPGTITISDPDASNSPQTINVGLNILPVGTDNPPFGDFATPTDGSIVVSSIPVTGWVLDDIGVQSVKIYRGTGLSDRVYIGDALFVKGARPDVEAAYPGYPQNDRAGWGYMLLTNFLPNGGNGAFRLLAYAIDTGGHEVLLGSKTITCDNLHAVKPFGAIDTPAQGGTASGSSYVNFGWALTPQPNSIPTDGSTLTVFVDGVPLGQPVYNLYRSDIATLFPGYANSNGAVGYYYLDTTAYPDGVHTIAWLVTDSGGNADGIGSRYFIIQNAAEGPGLNGLGANAQFSRTRQNMGMRSAAEIARIPEDGRTPVYVKRGYTDTLQTEMVFPEPDGSIRIQIPEVSMVAVYLNERETGEGEEERGIRIRRILYEAYELVLGELRPLPIGATFDAERGVLYWQPGPGFLGDFDFILVDGTRNTQKAVKIRIGAK